MKNLIPGMVVKCIDDHFVDERTNPFKIAALNAPVNGQQYTVREVVETSYGVGLRLEELQNKEYFFGNIKRYEEPIFSSERFETIKK